MTIDQVFKDADAPLPEDVRARFAANNIRTDNNKSFNNLVRMVTGSHNHRAMRMLEDQIFTDDGSRDMMMCTLLSVLEKYEAA